MNTPASADSAPDADATQPGSSPTRILPTSTLMLCVLTTAIFIGQAATSIKGSAAALGLVPAHISHLSSFTAVGNSQSVPAWMTLFTSIFLHGSWIHLIANMSALWVFGSIAEPMMGRRRFVLTYLLFGLVTAFAITAIVPHSVKPIVGASGAIAGILGAFSAMRCLATLHERGRRMLLVLETSAILLFTAWFLFRTVPVEPNRACSVAYHFVPFMLAWLTVHLKEHFSLRRQNYTV